MSALPYRAYLFDLDGTLYRGEEAIPGAAAAVARLRDGGAAIRFITNNSSLTSEAYAAKLRRLGFAADANELVSSGTATAAYLSGRGHRTAFVLGEEGLRITLMGAGIEPAEAPQNPTACVVGICRSLTYAKLDAAMQAIRQGAEFVATNTDATFPLEGGRFAPGAGSLVAAVATCSGRPPIVMGKPEPAMIRQALASLGVSPEQALVIGDRRDTDIEAGRRAGCPTWLVLTGVETALTPGDAGSPDITGLPGLVGQGAEIQ